MLLLSVISLQIPPLHLDSFKTKQIIAMAFKLCKTWFLVTSPTQQATPPLLLAPATMPSFASNWAKDFSALEPVHVP